MILETKNLTKKYRNIIAVNKVNLHIPERAVYGLLGPNGAGKTTILGMCTTLIKPSSGDVLIKGISAIKYPQKARETIGLMPQNSDFYPERTVKEHLEFYAKLSGVEIEKANEMIHMVGLEKRANSKIRELSHGMVKLVGIAQAFIADPEIVLLDEPVEGLDPRIAYNIKEIIKKYSRKKTIVLSSHYLEFVEKVCTHVGILSEGKLVKEGELKKIKAGKSLEQVFLRLA